MSTVVAEKALNDLPPEEVGSALLQLAEDQWFERKSARISARDLADTLIGFANAEGGIVVVGLHDGKIEGVGPNSSRLKDQMQANIDFCVPPVRARGRLVACTSDGGEADSLLAFEVSSSELVHTNQRDEVFLRVGDENRRLTFAQRQELLYDKGQASYEARALPETTFDDLDQSLLEEYVEAVGATDGGRVLQARGLSTDVELTIAGCLLFASFPQKFLPEGSRQQLLEDVKLEGPIPEQLMSARTLVRRLQPTRRALMSGGKFGSVPLVPGDAWLEGIVNAAVHRSYGAAGDHIRVEIFDDRIEISSPGRFPGLVDLSDPLETSRFARTRGLPECAPISILVRSSARVSVVCSRRCERPV
jgi:ATP-dependent DNA helicase RecG